MEKSLTIMKHIIKISLVLTQKTFEFIAKVLELAVKSFFLVLLGIGQESSGATAHNARFKEDTWDVLSFWNKGLRIGDKALPIELSTRHVSIFGPSGSGKTMSIFLNTLLSANGSCSYVVRDPAGQAYTLSSGRLAQIGYDVKLVNLSHAKLSSDAWNPLAGNLNSGDINRIGELIVSNIYGNGTGDAYWRQSAKELCYLTISILKEQPDEFHTFYNLKRMTEQLAADEASLDMMVAKSKNENIHLAYKSFIGTPEKTRLSTVATLKAALSSFSDENLIQITGRSTFEWTDTRKRPTAIFVSASVLDDQYLNLIQSIYCFRLMNDLMAEIPKQDDLAVQLLVDEASSLTLGDFLETILANSRKYRVSVVLAYQALAQVERAYGKSASTAILANTCTRIFFPGMDLQTAQELETILGKHEIADENGHKKVEPLMSAFSIRTMEKGRAIMLCDNHPAMLIDATPYYKISRFKERSKIPPKPIRPISEQKNAKLSFT